MHKDWYHYPDGHSLGGERSATEELERV